MELVTVEDSGNSVEIPLKESEPEAFAETGAVLFSNFGGVEKDESFIEAEVFKRDINKVKENPKVDIDAILEVSDEGQHKPEEDPVYYMKKQSHSISKQTFSDHQQHQTHLMKRLDSRQKTNCKKNRNTSATHC